MFSFNLGIGYEAAEDFAKRGAKVILACRNESRGKDAENRIIKATDNRNVHYKQLDLSSLKSVRQFAEDINKNEDRYRGFFLQRMRQYVLIKGLTHIVIYTNSFIFNGTLNSQKCLQYKCFLTDWTFY